MHRLSALLKKEFLLLSRDLHALMVLFVMPAAFILIMSLAMEGLFVQGEGRGIGVFIYDRNQTPESADFIRAFSATKGIAAKEVKSVESGVERVMSKEGLAVLVLEESFSRRLSNPELGPAVTLHADAALTAQARTMIESVVLAHLSATGSRILMRSFGMEETRSDRLPVAVLPLGAQKATALPTAVQQSVPAWLIFSMFFLVIPIANALIAERRSGTLLRLAAFNVPASSLLLGKLIPYVSINQVQFFLMLGVGVYLVPLCGGERLEFSGSPALLWSIALCVSLAAIAYGLMIASLARTTDQATTIGGVSNILLAALGGVMIPVFAMPAWMQPLSALSPMSWGLEAFLAVSVRGMGLAEIAPKLGVLLSFAAGCFLASYLILVKRIKGGYRGA